MKKSEVGKWGEDLAADYLVSQGYAIVERNWKMHHYEVDIIAMTGKYMVFVEVKTRTSDDYDPVSAVNTRKRQRIIASADVYLRNANLPHEFRFDIVSITGRFSTITPSSTSQMPTCPASNDSKN